MSIVSGSGWRLRVAGGGLIHSVPESIQPSIAGGWLSIQSSMQPSTPSSTQSSIPHASSFTAPALRLWVTGMSKRLPGLVIEVEDLPGFLAKPDEDILQHVRSVLLLRAYAVQRAQLAKCDGVKFSPTKDSCVFSAKGRALLHVRFAQLKA